MKTQNHMLAYGLLLSLMGCGGSGGDNTTPEPSANQPPSTIPKPPTTEKPAPETAWDKLSDEEKIASVGFGGDNYFVRLNSTEKNQTHNLSFPDQDNIYKLKIEDTVIHLKDNSAQAPIPSWKMFAGSSFTSEGTTSKEIAYLTSYIGSKNFTTGVIGLTDKNYHEYAFIQGNYTAEDDIPTQAEVTYKVGVGFHLHRSENEEGFIQGFGSPRTIKVDFAQRKVSGEFKLDDNDYHHDVVIDADIKGNRFHSADDATTKVKGGFFGPDAGEIGGIFQTKQAIGVFAGAKETAATL